MTVLIAIRFIVSYQKKLLFSDQSQTTHWTAHADLQQFSYFYSYIITNRWRAVYVDTLGSSLLWRKWKYKPIINSNATNIQGGGPKNSNVIRFV